MKPADHNVNLKPPLESLQHVAILASAGSGKTHALSGRYLTLLAAGAPPQSIVASTFTRAAAGEIRDRLLRRLALAVDDAKEREGLREQIGVKTLSADQVRSLLAHVARHLHVLAVRTLDAFFSSIARAFAVELGLPAEAAIVDEVEDKAMRHEAMRLMLDEGDPQPLIELLRLLTRGDSDRGVMNAIDRVVTDLYDLSREANPQAWDCVPVAHGALDAAALQHAIDALLAIPMAEDDRLAKPHAEACANAHARDWGKFTGKGIGAKVAACETLFNRKPIPEDLIAVYQPLVRHVAADGVMRLRDQTLATRDLLGRFERHYAALKLRRRVMTFSDLTHAMRRIALLGGGDREGDGDIANETLLADIGFRLDGRVQHLLLDEFQDTSHAQWRAMLPMAGEIASIEPPDRTFFCVGDVKQSIYGWRGASPEILERLTTALPGVTEEHLDVSWRSSPVVIDAVNRTFSGLSVNAALADGAEHEAAAMGWGGLFHEHSCAPKVAKEAGFVQLRFAKRVPVKGESALRHRERLRLAANIVKDLHLRNTSMRIGVLTRSNASVARVLFELGPANLGLAASGRGGGPLIDAPPVNAMLDLLRMADHPDDTISAFNVANSPLGAALKFTDDANRAARRRLARNVRERLLIDGYQATLAAWFSLIASHCDSRQLRRAMQLVELAGLHDQQEPGLRTGGFIAMAEQTSVPDAQPAPIEVMTIHQAKGLEFDAVVLPDLQGMLAGHGAASMILERDAHDGTITRICRYAGEDVRKHVPGLEELHQAQKVRTIREGLSTLYVAMTRAKHGLYMLVDPPSASERQSPKSAAGVLRAVFAPDATQPDSVVHVHGDAEWMKRIKTRTNEAAALAKHIDRIDLRTGDDDAARGVAAMSASKFAERHAALSAAGALRGSLRLTNPEGRERGSVIHALFERITWLEDFNDDDATLLTMSRALAPRRDERWHLAQIAAFRSMLTKPAIAKAMSSGGESTSLARVEREWPYVRATDGGIQSGSIDRLVLRLDERGRAIGATVIDFKTDAIVEGSPQAQAETHREQLQMYREVVAEMFGLAGKSITMQVLLVGAGEAIVL